MFIPAIVILGLGLVALLGVVPIPNTTESGLIDQDLLPNLPSPGLPPFVSQLPNLVPPDISNQTDLFPQPELTDFMITYHWWNENPEQYRTHLDVARSALKTEERGRPLIVRLDIFWGDVQPAQDTWNFSSIDTIFTKVLDPDVNPNDQAYIILGTHAPPTWLSDPKDRWSHPEEGVHFINNVTDYVKTRGWSDRVFAWQVDNEPFALPIDLDPNLFLVPPFPSDPILVVRTLSLWVEAANANVDQQIAVNPYTIFGRGSYDFLIRTDYSDDLRRLFTNLDIMAIDIYVDQPQLAGSFVWAVSTFRGELQIAREYFGFNGTWGVAEMAGGPRYVPSSDTFIPTPSNITTEINYLQTRTERPSLIGLFQLTDGPKWEKPEVFDLFGDSYGLIDFIGNVRTEYLEAIRSAIRV